MGRHFDRLDAWLIATSVVASLAIAFVHCGEGAVCGNGVQEEGEACDSGAMNGIENSGCSATCTIAALNVAKINIGITHLNVEAVGYMGAGCTELGSSTQHVVLDGPQGFDETWDCNKTNSIIPNVTPGDYKLSVTLLDSAGNPLTKTVTSMTATAAKMQTVSLSVNFAQTDFLKQDYTGTLFFKPSWGAASTTCAMASPVVTGYGILLKNKAGQLVSGMSTGSHSLDGTSGPCFIPASNGTPEGVANLTWGHYELSFTGYAGAALAYCKTFDVFSGPGVANNTYDLLVTESNADAGACP